VEEVLEESNRILSSFKNKKDKTALTKVSWLSTSNSTTSLLTKKPLLKSLKGIYSKSTLFIASGSSFSFHSSYLSAVGWEFEILRNKKVYWKGSPSVNYTQEVHSREPQRSLFEYNVKSSNKLQESEGHLKEMAESSNPE